ncbi:MAG: zinc metalloprotease HtpX [Theionarchaea archaeon]|nr:zinc metalloprotease HtpX [Theionarchaea archaeon]MBU7001820.1 zinc metalloprotease HtpX [Theionarchaea archaeon]MBU7020465.1 zinc metalloprotease HtpX [Theionarchaea archaeon]MBU7035676.1 zinc metalloprotease HtpX [Theionarchaea archaeon]MBU7041087.1 zinc metalloprotease HtpX [Theionarchaea archaeon]
MKTALLMAVLTGLLMATGYIVGMVVGVDPFIMVTIAFALAMALNFVSYWYSDRIVLRMYRADIVSENIAPELYSMISGLALKAGLPTPKIAIINNETPNAFATGRNPENAVVAVTSGALSLLRREELEAVLAHELGHIKNRDMFISTVAAVLAGTVGYLGFMGRMMLWTRGSRRDSSSQLIGVVLLAVFIPLAALLIRLAISRGREYQADESGAVISGNPDALADALIRIEDVVKRKPLKQGSPATAHLFIVNPFKTDSLIQLLSTHPTTASRVKKLRELAQTPYR